ncbi:MAG: DNA-processing protein DprA, partial [Ancrocorticia sp.]|nr:DNA-processing protein DprA [Ancrocorticia sp.]
MVDDEKMAAMAWTRLAEGEDSAANRLVRAVGFHGALRLVEQASHGETAELAAHGIDPARWVGRFDPTQFEKDRTTGESLGGFIWPGDPMWPPGFEYLGETAPLGLWYRGTLEALRRPRENAEPDDVPALAIVGSRAASTYGVRIASAIASEASEAGVTIVSGGAIGIDAAAHRGALAVHGRTSVVFAGGLDRPYPVSHGSLFHSVLDSGGVLVSESPPGSSPLRHRFLARNRIIAALANATVVVEASYRSGALSTARHALTIGRSVGAVPGPVTSPSSVGCHRLLREGAICVTSAA